MEFKVSDAATELAGFLASFLSTGAVAFRYILLRGDAAAEPRVAPHAARRAAALGVAGALVTALLYVMLDLRQTAEDKHTSLIGAMTEDGASIMAALCIALVLVGLGLAVARVRFGWALAAGGVLIGPLTNLFYSQWARAVNPIHRLAGGLWIGTLFIMLAAGFTAILTSELDAVRRGQLAASMVARFSPLALSAFAVLATSGLITAWKHIKRIDNLWTTSYGWTLIAKLCVVLIVVGLGAWNWRRQRPLMGTESAASVLRRSATAEVIAATVVLIITSVLVSLPSPH